MFINWIWFRGGTRFRDLITKRELSMIQLARRKPARLFPVIGKLLVFLLLLLSNGSRRGLLWAQENTYTILGLSVEGNVLTDDNLLLLNSGLGVNDQVTLLDIQEAIRRLWKLERFEDIRMEAERVVGSGVYLLIRVKELPLLGKVEIAGNDGVRRSKIQEVVDQYLFLQRPLSWHNRSRLRNALLDLYHDEGYLQARVELELTGDPASGVLHIYIKENQQVRIRGIEFLGIQELSAKKLRRVMKETRTRRWWRSGFFDRKKFQDDLQLVLDYCRDRGYNDAEILGDSLVFSEDGRSLYLFIKMYEGPRYRFGKITWQGNTLFQDERLNDISLFRILVFVQGDAAFIS
jgi:outer membrane protein insertion porin family